MFETSLVVRPRSRRRGWMLGLAVLIHVGVATAVVLASAWSVRPVAPPELEETLYLPLPPPPLGNEAPAPKPPSPPVPHPPSTPAKSAPQPPPPRLLEMQPKDVPAAVPVAPSVPSNDDIASTRDANSDRPSSGPGVPWGDPRATGGDEAPLDITVGMTRPEAIFKVTPAYTEQARLGRIQGVVIVRATIDREGRVTGAQVIKPLGFGLDQNAVAAVQQWRFRPATLNGRPVPVYFQLSVTFSVR